MPDVPTRSSTPPPFVIRPLATDDEARACAGIMATSDPWLTLGRTVEASYRIVRDPAREVYVAVPEVAEPRHRVDGASVAGFAIVVMQGAFVGYIQTVAVHAAWRGRGLGTTLIGFAERRILRDEPNVFICASSFNPGARRLYERLGYRVVGELTDYVVRGHSEILLRKTTGPLAEHVAPADQARG
jgi:ribosomal protein S18 acetylase RimI-like enzyme